MSTVDTSEILRCLDEELPASVERNEAGFYFEEGGCWAFAVALKKFFDELGILASIRTMKGYRHAFVSVGGMLVDHTGAAPETRYRTTKSSVEEIGERGVAGCGIEQFESDLMWADEIIREAAYGCPGSRNT